MSEQQQKLNELLLRLESLSKKQDLFNQEIFQLRNEILVLRNQIRVENQTLEIKENQLDPTKES